MPNKPVEIKRKHVAEIFVSMFLIMVMSVCFSVWSANRIVKSEHEAAQKQAVAAMTPVCKYLYATDVVYRETPPTTPAGMQQHESVKNLIISFQCERFVPRGQ